MVFPVVMYGCENWTIKKAECQRIDAFELWCWIRLLRVPWTARRSNQSILKEINPGCSLEGLMLKLKLQYFSHLMWRTESFEKTVMVGKIEGRGRREWQRVRWLNGITELMDMSLSIWLSQRVRHDWATDLNWTPCPHPLFYKSLPSCGTYQSSLLFIRFMGFPGDSEGKESAYIAENLGSVPGLWRSPGRGHGNPLQCSYLENFTYRGAWRVTVPGVTKSQTRLSD